MNAPLSLSMTHAQALIDAARPDFAGPMGMAMSGSPYLVDLPAFQGGLGATISQSEMNIIATLYFLAEVEGTYLLSVGEELAKARFTLNLTDRDAAAQLEKLASAIGGDWIDRDLRNSIFTRVFGLGYADQNLGAAVNPEFEPRFARLCSALIAASYDLAGWGAPAGAAMRGAVAVQSLLSNLSSRVQGNTLIVAERLSNQLRLTLDALNHPGLASLFRGRTAWDVVRAVLGADTPDLQAHINRAQTGLRLLSWTATNLTALRNADSQNVTTALQSEPQLQGWAEVWLTAAGIPQTPASNQNSGWLQ